MIPPTSIDGTDITGATIDGTDVQEITVDGDVVFSAEQLPVAYSNLTAWYPFDAAEYGGANADDVTAIIGGSGDDTAYDGTVNGATYQSSGGITDINAGANSGGFDFSGSNNQRIQLPNAAFDSTSTFSMTFWLNADDNSASRLFNANDDDDGFRVFYEDGKINNLTQFEDSGNRDDFNDSPIFGQNTWAMFGVTFDDSINEANAYIGFDANNGVTNYDTITTNGSRTDPIIPTIGASGFKGEEFNGQMDDLRIYNTALSASQIQDIYDNTEP